MTDNTGISLSRALAAGLRGRCPNCSRGRLFRGFLDVAPACDVCGFDLTRVDSGDGPAVFVVLILGFLVVAAALVVEIMFAPPYWLHLVLWLPLTIAGGLLLLRPFKGVLIALQFKHRAEEARLDGHHPDD